MGNKTLKNGLQKAKGYSKTVIQQVEKTIGPSEAKKLMRENLMFVKRENEVLFKYPGDLQGKQFKLENNKWCEIYIKDNNAGGFCDKWEDCIIFWGPSTSSVFIRDCKNCRFVIIWQQLRLRDCHNCEIMLFSQTDPILESSSNIKYWWNNFSYPELQEQMDKWKISIWNNTWTDQYDFTANSNKTNFQLIDEEAENFIESFDAITKNVMLVQAQQVDPTIDQSQIDFIIEEEMQVPLIPITTGSLPKEAQYQAFVLFLDSDSSTVHQIYSFLYFEYFRGKRDQYWIKGKPKFIIIVETRQVQLTDSQLGEVLNWDTSSQDYNDQFFEKAKGQILIGMHLCAAVDDGFSKKLAAYLSERHVDLDFYLSFSVSAVEVQSVKFFKEYNKDDKGQKME